MGKEDGTGKLNPDHAAVIPNAKFYPGIGAYGHYRFGLTMAGIPYAKDHPDISPYGPMGENPFSAAYSDEDQQIIDLASRICGFAPKSLSSNRSKEPDDVCKASPVNHNSGHHHHHDEKPRQKRIKK